jgi:hypothetical protein
MQAAAASPAAAVTRTGAVGCVVQPASISSALSAARLRTMVGITLFIIEWIGGFYREILGSFAASSHIPAGQCSVNRPHPAAYLRCRDTLLNTEAAERFRFM